MAARRPIVSAGGRRQQLPAGDTLLGVPAYLPVHQQSGAMLRVGLDLDYGLPVTLAAGGSLTVQVAING